MSAWYAGAAWALARPLLLIGSFVLRGKVARHCSGLRRRRALRTGSRGVRRRFGGKGRGERAGRLRAAVSAAGRA